MSDSFIHYRPARPVDADQVHLLIAAAADESGSLVEQPDEISAEHIRTRIRNTTNRRNRLFLVATEQEKIIGMCSLECHELRALQHIRYMSLIVDPQYRRRGIGKELLRQSLEWAQETEGVEKIELRVRERNFAGVNLCFAFGFEKEGTLKHHIALPNGKRLNDILLAKFINHVPATKDKK
ncbi:MAG TPA: GNAT family N-acetyltransferase [bacterium]|nr:GNAT family N-acetyltransferase [bacterium]